MDHTEDKYIPVTAGAQLEDWFAWHNTGPPDADRLHISGKILVPNTGIEAQLIRKADGETSSPLVRLELRLVQKPGEWSKVATNIEVRHDEFITGVVPSRVQVLSKEVVIAEMNVQTGFPGLPR